MKKILQFIQLSRGKNLWNALFLICLFTLPLAVSAGADKTSSSHKITDLSITNWHAEELESSNNNNNNAGTKPSEKNEETSEFVFTPTTTENSEAHVPSLLPAKSTYGVVVFKKKRNLVHINSNSVDIQKIKTQEKLKAKHTFNEIARPEPHQAHQIPTINLSENSSAASFGNAPAGSVTQKNLNSAKDLRKLTEKNRELNLLRFTENKGQVRDQNENPRPDVLFYGQDGKMGFHIKNNGISYQLYKIIKWKKADFGEKFKHENNEIPDEYSVYRIDLNWLNSNTKAQWRALNAFEDVANFYNVPNSDGVTNVNSYGNLLCENLYKGVDLKYYESEGGLKHDYIISPGADYKQIQIEIKGAKPFLNTDGHLFLETPQGKIQEFKPRAFQNGSEVAVKYVIRGNVLSYSVENYDPNQELVIDPLTRLWGTYYGGTSTEYGRAVDTDAAGNVLMAGYTLSSGLNIISTAGSHQINISGGWDAFVVKFNTSGVRQWATYYGGSSTDYGYGVCSDAANNVFITGYTTSSNNIASVGAHKAVYNSADAFLVKFNSAGVRQWGTYYGGTATEEGYAVDTDASGAVYMVGYTSGSTTDIATPGSHDSISNGADAFLVKFNTSGVRQWATYYGGSSSDYGYWVCTDNLSNVYITGYTISSDAISTPGAHKVVYNSTDAFLVKFDSAGVRQWGTYYGGTSTEYGYGVCADAANNVFLAGYTSGSATEIASVGAHDSIVNGADAFLVKFTPNGVRLWGTYYGGTSTEYGYGVTTNPTTGHSFLTGYTSSTADIATAGAHDVSLAGTDAFIAEFNPSGVRQWGSYYGGTATEYGYSICSDNAGNIFLSGWTSGSAADIATVGAHDVTVNGNDAFLVKWQNCIGPAAALNTTSINNLQRCVNQTAPLSASGSGTIRWFATETSTVTLATGGNYTTPALTPAGVYTYYVTADNSCSQSFPRTAVTVTAITSPTITLNNQNICSGGSATLIPSGGITYTWSTSAVSPSIVVSPLVNTVYTVQSGVTGCIGTQTAMVTVSVQPAAPVITPSVLAAICGGTAAPTFTASGSTGIYAWYNNINGPVISTNTVYTTPTLSSSATYYLAAAAATLQTSVGTYTFTNAGATGNIGPTQSQVNTAYATTNLNGLVTITGQGIQNFTVPASGVYRIRARGAQGGFSGGLGASMQGDFTLNAGEVIRIIVGQQGTGSGPGGGGGGSFVVRAPFTTTNSILVIAGGGSGAGNYATNPGLTTANGGLGGVAGGTNGTGGLGGTRGAGGGGFLTNGAFSSVSSAYANPGIAFVNGGQGGAPTNNCGFNGAGGFGGGSSHGGNCIQNGGAGGGFSGGGGSSNTPSGGGGSLNNGTNQINQQGINSGNGLVIIEPISVASLAGCTSVKVPITINVGPVTPTITVSNQTICANASATVSASGASSYTWNTNANTSSIVVTPSVSSVYTVVAGTAPCTSQQTLNVGVVNQPAPPIITPASQTICGVGNTTLVASGSGSNYMWFNAPNGPIIANTNSFVTQTLTNTSLFYASAFIGSVSPANSFTFNFTGAPQTWVVPAGVTQITVTANGAKGIDSPAAPSNTAGLGGRVTCVYPVVPGQVLNIYVGGTTGYNGGGIGSATYGGNGGGASDIRINGTALANRIIVAGGGGGGGYNCATLNWGGGGGGLTGVSGFQCNTPGTYATGGTQISGGTGIGPGTLGQGGNGANTYGGGGGGGYYGGGGAAYGGGGGGSSYTDPAATSVVHTQSVSAGNGSVIISVGAVNLACTSALSAATINVGPTSPTISVSNQTICTSQSATLIASGAPTYTWNTSATTSSIIVTPTVATTYTVSSGIAPCVDQKTVSVTLTVQPNPPAVTPSFAAVCGSLAPTFTASGSSGIYAWYNAINGPIVGTGSVFTTPTLTNTSTFYLAAAVSSVASAGQTYTFTNASATGSLGPTQAQVNTAYASTNLNNSVTVNPQGIQTFTVPQTGTYRIRAAGASANNGPSTNFGIKGRIIQENITLNAGDVLRIAVGQMGTIGNGGSSGGGGGSFVSRVVGASTVPVIVAGGGGGQYLPLTSTVANSNGSILQAGFNGIDNTGIGGTGGNGGTGSPSGWGGGGGGFNTNGTAAASCPLSGGFSFLNNGNGGNTCSNAPGGFGGGGGTHGNTGGGGGGGGYSGGGGCAQSLAGTNAGGGGGSFFNASATNTLDIGFNIGHGFVVLEAIAIAAPATCQSTLVPITVTVGPTQPTITANSQTICANQSATIVASGAPSYTWNTNATTSSIVVSPAATTIYTVTSGFGICAGQKTVDVNVIPVPNTPTVTPNNFTLCSNSNTILTAASNSTLYAWSTLPNGPAFATTPTLAVSGLTTNTTYYVAAAAATAAASGSLIFNHTGSSQVWTVPQGVTSVTVQAWGAEGGGIALSGNSSSGDGGKGGYAAGILTVTPGSTLQINVGGHGLSSNSGPAAGGFNGGGSGYASSSGEPGNGGGGATDVRVGGTAFNNRVIVAGGGGGGGEDFGDPFGHGGGLTGVNYPAYDATQTAAGAGGGFGFGGTTGQGDGGGGGGGWYGGGTFSTTSIGGDTQGGGGGSGYIGGVTAGTLIAGNLTMPSFSVGTMLGNSGHGKLIIRWSGSGNLCPSPLATVNIVGQVGPTVTVSNSQTICTAQSATLTASGAPNYLWSTSSTSSVIVVSPVSSTIYTVTGGSAPCADQKTIGITVTVQPTPPTVTPTLSAVCGSIAPTFTASGSSGIYTWYSAINGPVVGTGSVYTTPTLTNTATYYLAAAISSVSSSGQTYTFTNAAATGSSGPTQAQINTAYVSTNLNNSVTVNPQGIQNFTVPQTGTYRIDARGAGGGSVTVTCPKNGGLGARMVGDFVLTAGTVIKILVGQTGQSNGSDAGGGGGSFVTDAANNPLVVAGGGGGASNNVSSCGGSTLDGVNATITTSGTASGNSVVLGGVNGNGGGASSGSGGGGGGLLTNGTPGSGNLNGNGKSFVNGGAGGSGSNNNSGGFGGGGCGWHTGGNGGGGGGYSGGATSGNSPYTGGGGGGSFNNGTNQLNTAGFNAGNGLVIIQQISIPGPATCQSTLVPITVSVGPTQPTITANNQTICANQSATLQASGAPTYTWNTSATTSSIVVTPASTTVYTVTSGFGICAGQRTVGVNVLPFPNTPTVTPNNFTLCSNINTVLTAASNATAYAWYTVPNGSIIASSPTLAVANLTSNATYYVAAAAATIAPNVSYTFTTAGATGSAGPTQAQINTAYASTNLNGLVTSNSGVQLWTAPFTGVYNIDAYGAQGGGLTNGGLGARISGQFTLTAGQQLRIVVGQKGVDGTGGAINDNGGGGGGGSFIVSGTNSLLIAAGGGGGGLPSKPGGPGLITNNGGSTWTGGGGTGGNGGNEGITNGPAAGGGGFFTNGVNSSNLSQNPCEGGRAFLNGSNGGQSGFQGVYFGGHGGFGGGGSGWHNSLNRCGGGGGYSGGQGGNWSTAPAGPGGGGGSFNSGVNQINTQGVNSGNGLVIISTIGNGNLCASPLATVNISALPGPTVTAAATNTFLCTGTLSSVLSATGASSYTWFPLNVNTNTVLVTPTLSTTYTVQGQNPNGCIDTKTVLITACALLPVELLSFDAIKNAAAVDLYWVTQTELNCEKFYVERTTDFNSWQFICEVKGSGNSTSKKSYGCKDFSPERGINYYRLKQFDYDGSFVYSPIRQVKFDSEGDEVFEVIPNPNDGKFDVIFDVDRNAEITIELTDAYGRIISESLTFKENFTGIKQIEINIRSLAAGVYFVNKKKENGVVSSKKVIKAY